MVAIGALACDARSATTSTWTYTSSGTWQTASDWLGGVPNSSTDAIFNLNSNYSITFTANATANHITDNRDGVHLLLNGFTLTASSDLRIGETGGSQFEVNGGTLALGSGNIYAADTNIGGFVLDSNAVVTTTGYLKAGNTNGGFGSAVAINTGAQLTTGTVGLATNAAATLSASIGDTGSLWTVNGDLGIGGYGNLTSGGAATLTINTGGTVAVSGTTKVWGSGTLNVSGGQLTTKNLDTSAGNLTFTGGTITINGGTLKPKQQPVTLNYAPSSSYTHSNSFAVSGTVGSSSRPILSLIGGGTSSLSYVSSVYDASIFIGLDGGNGGAVVSGSNSLLSTSTSSGDLFIGAGAGSLNSNYYGGNGSVSLTNGGQASSYYDSVIGYDGGSGNVSVDGANSKLTSTNDIDVGNYAYSNTLPGVGTLSLTNGGQASSYYDSVIGYGGGSGNVSVDGANSKLTSTNGGLFVGDYAYSNTLPGVGTLSLTNGGQASGHGIDIGDEGGSGNVSVDGANSKLTSTNGGIDVGDYAYSNTLPGVGTLSLTNGGQASSYYDTYIGYEGGSGSVSVKGGALNVGGILHVGEYTYYQAGTGSLSITNAGSLTSNGALVGDTTGIGTVALTGSGSTWTNTGSLNIGNDGTGSASANGTGTVALTSSAALTNTGLLKVYSGGTLTVSSGASLTTGSLDISSAGSFSLGGGTIIISGGALQTPTGHGTTIGDGVSIAVLQLHNGGVSGGSLSIAGKATFAGTGSLITSMVLQPGSTLAPGENAPGKITTAGSVTLQSSGAVHAAAQFELGSAASPGVTYDQVQMTGGTFVDGGATLQLLPIGGVTIGTTYAIVTTSSGGGSIDNSNLFSNLVPTLPGVALYTNGIITATVTYSSSEIDATFLTVPEPLTGGAIMLCGTAVMSLRPRKKKVVHE